MRSFVVAFCPSSEARMLVTTAGRRLETCLHITIFVTVVHNRYRQMLGVLRIGHNDATQSHGQSEGSLC